MPVALPSLQHTADIFDTAGCVVQLYADSKDRCEATAAKINGHPDYAGAPTIGCYTVSGCHLTLIFTEGQCWQVLRFWLHHLKLTWLHLISIDVFTRLSG